MNETKTREPLLFAPLEDEPDGNFPEPVALTPEQLAAQAEAEEQDRLRRLDWAEMNQALRDNSMAVTRAMRRFRREGEQEQAERVLAGFQDGGFLINRLGAECVLDQDLAAVLLHLRRKLIDNYGDRPAVMMLIDRAVAAYQSFIRIEGWVGNAALMVEAEFFGRDKPSAEFRDRHGRKGCEIRGLTVEEHLTHLREGLIPLAERSGRVMREALAALEALRSGPSQVVERSRPVAISVMFEATGARLASGKPIGRPSALRRTAHEARERGGSSTLLLVIPW